MLVREELELVGRAKAGERDALAELWDEITPKLYGYLVNVLRDKALAEDILQETWLKAIVSLSKFRPQGVRFSAWLFAIARNVCREHWRRDGRVQPLDEYTHTEMASDDRLGEKIFVEKILKELKEEDREILRLRYLADLSFKDIACILHISDISARVRVHRALGRANKLLQTY